MGLSFGGNALDSTALREAVPSGTMLYDNFAPLAQLAEQLTHKSKNAFLEILSNRRLSLVF